MQVKIELSNEQANSLTAKAEELGIGVNDLARAWLVDLLSQSDEHFNETVSRVVNKNHDLYKRLS